MALLQRGKTKDVYSHGDYTLELKFTDRVTLNDQGEVDPGGNNVSDSLATGQGFACLSMTTTIFSYLAANGIPTHMVSYDLDNLSMVVRKAVTFKPGLEWVCRWRGTGSFIRRYKTVPGAKDGMVFSSPVSLHFNASSIATLIAWLLSGAGRIPSILAKVSAAAKTSVCSTALASIYPSW